MSAPKEELKIKTTVKRALAASSQTAEAPPKPSFDYFGVDYDWPMPSTTTTTQRTTPYDPSIFYHTIRPHRRRTQETGNLTNSTQRPTTAFSVDILHKGRGSARWKQPRHRLRQRLGGSVKNNGPRLHF